MFWYFLDSSLHTWKIFLKENFSNILLLLFKTLLHLTFLKLQLMMPDSSSTYFSFLIDKIKCDCWCFTKNIWEMSQNPAVSHLFEELFLFKENIKLINNWDSWFLTSGDWEVSSKIQPFALLMNSWHQWIRHGYVCMLIRVQLCDPMDSGLPGSSVHGISKARIL